MGHFNAKAGDDNEDFEHVMSRHGMGLGMMMEIHLLNSVANTV
jgi:hypothetical protein